MSNDDLGARIIGPFRESYVVLHGYAIPYLQAARLPDGKISLLLDSRFGFDVESVDFERTADFIAQCIAVAGGFTGHPGEGHMQEPRPRSLYHRMIGLDFTAADEGGQR